MIPLFEPYLEGNEKKYVLDCLETNWISSQGDYIKLFEKSLSEYHELKYCVATSSCTSALHLALKALGIGPGDEVICPDLTFIAPANMVVLSGATLVLVDVDLDTLNIDPGLLEQKITKKTKAVIVVHQFGHSAPMDEILSITKKYNLKVIEDNAESLGAKYKGKRLGTFGDLATFSFFGNKIITTGEGGAILTNNEELAMKSAELRDHGMSRDRKYYHNDLGYNYRMTNLQAAVGLGQIEQLDKILSIRKNQMEYYYSLLTNIKHLKLRKFQSWCEPVHWLTTVTFEEEYDRNLFLDFMKNRGIDCRQMINPVHKAKHLENQFKPEEYPISNKVSSQSAHLPCSTSLRKSDIEIISKSVNDFINSHES